MIVHAAYYDPATGVIIQTSSGDRASIEANPRPFIELDEEAPMGFDITHRVVGGEVAPTGNTYPPTVVAARTLDAPSEFTGSQTGPLQVTLTWRNPRATSFDHITIFRGGSADSSPIIGGLGAPMTVMTNPPASGNLVYFLRAYDVDGVNYVDSDPITVAVS